MLRRFLCQGIPAFFFLPTQGCAEDGLILGNNSPTASVLGLWDVAAFHNPKN